MSMIKRFRLALESSDSHFIPSDLPKIGKAKEEKYQERLVDNILMDIELKLEQLKEEVAMTDKNQLEDLKSKVLCLEASNVYMEEELKRLEALRDEVSPGPHISSPHSS